MTALLMDQGKTSSDRLAVPSLGNTFRIPKRKFPASGTGVQMQSPLSRLPESSSLKVQWGRLSQDRRRSRGLGQLDGTRSSDISQMSNGSRTDRVALLGVLKVAPPQEMHSEAVRIHVSSLQNDPVTQHKGAAPQTCSDTWVHRSARRPLPPRPQSSPLKRFRPKRASDTLCHDENLQGAPSSPKGRRSNVGLRGSLQLEQEREVGEKTILEHTGSSPGESKRFFRSDEIKEEERERRAILGPKMKVEDTGVTVESSNPTGLPRSSAPHHPSRTRGEESVDKQVSLAAPAGSVEGGEVALLLRKDPKRVSSASQRRRLQLEKVFPPIRHRKPSLRPTEPIVLSSDEEEVEKDGRSHHLRISRSRSAPESKDELATEKGAGAQTEKRDMHPAESRTSASGLRAGRPAGSTENCSEESSLVELQFLTLHAGGAVVEANGNIMVTADCLIVTVKDPSGEAVVSLALVPSELRGYCTWAGQPSALLLFLWVSDAQARLVQQELSVVRPVGQPEQACPFLLLTLKESADGLQGALLASLLDVMGQRCAKLTVRLALSRDRATALVRSSPWVKTLLPLLESKPSPALEQDQLELTSWCPQLGSLTRRSLRRAGTSASQELSASRRLIQYPPPPSKGGITVRMEDLDCLNSGEFLNDVVIDFYLKYLILEKAPKEMAERSHIFSSFFYKQLTRRGGAGEGGAGVSPKRRRHHRVRTWTRNVDIFNKDFLFLPVNQEAHWYLVVICFPWLESPVREDRGIQSAHGNSGVEKRRSFQAAGPAIDDGKETTESNSASADVRRGGEMYKGGPEADPRVARGTPSSLPECTQLGCQRKTVCKRPCILVMDSLKLSRHEQIFTLLREYLEVEWEVRRGTPRGFTAEQVVGSHCRVPLQDNSSDCGLYLLQYAESFLQNPVVHFDLPVHLEHWFPRQRVRMKRHQIRELVVQLYRKQGGGT
ncbi:sentrin-specific protease 7-like isoform X2 [Brienomyrus brachyistius]|uniref:sentrin-specific protease 7-like isoform X2 n=1 Tax=Brienomyrus brachyistius TaxID=42636 RepID=UPI0020B3550B|nr:sentrin-specific protease 7-like isoform X2 [Brienomyrus brachyistius]